MQLNKPDISFGGNEKKAINQRKHIRPGLMASVGLELTEERPSVEAYTVNASVQGMALYRPKPLSFNTMVNAKILFVDARGEEVIERVNGSVIGCLPIGRLFGVGIKNDFLDSKEHPILLGFTKQTKVFK